VEIHKDRSLQQHDRRYKNINVNIIEICNMTLHLPSSGQLIKIACIVIVCLGILILLYHICRHPTETLTNPIDNKSINWKYWEVHDPDFLKYANLKYFNKDILNLNVQQENAKLFDIMKSSPLGSRFVDVGAFNGDTTLDIARKLKAYGRTDIQIIAIEPNTRHCEFIMKCATKESLNVEVIQKVASDDQGYATIFGKGKGSGTMYMKSSEGSFESDTLDNILKKYDSIFLMKIDTEGHEDKVLAGAKSILKDLKYLYIEMWNDEHYFKRTNRVHAYNRAILSYLGKFYALQKIEKNVLFRNHSYFDTN
jgi:FkbM family methyltransferase